jgi:hypothetical protein
MEEMRDTKRSVFWKSYASRPVCKPMWKWEDNIKIYFNEMWRGGVDWIDVAQGTV